LPAAARSHWAASLRGVTFDVLSAAPPTVAMYMNDAPGETNLLFQSMRPAAEGSAPRGLGREARWRAVEACWP